MEHYEKIKQDPNFKNYCSVRNFIKSLSTQFDETSIKRLDKGVYELVPKSFDIAYRYEKDLEEVQQFSIRFYTNEEIGFGNELGFRYSKITFDSISDIRSEINWIENLLKVYNPKKFTQEKTILLELKNCLEEFTQKFRTAFYDFEKQQSKFGNVIC